MVVVVVRMAVVCMAVEHHMVLPILLRIIIPCQLSLRFGYSLVLLRQKQQKEITMPSDEMYSFKEHHQYDLELFLPPPPKPPCSNRLFVKEIRTRTSYETPVQPAKPKKRTRTKWRYWYRAWSSWRELNPGESCTPNSLTGCGFFSENKKNNFWKIVHQLIDHFRLIY